MSIMEEVFLRFPHIGIQFFEKLDDSNLAKCREVSKSWKNFIDSEELPRKRVHRNWEKTLQDYPCKNSQTKLLVALVTDQNEMFKVIFNEERQNLKPINDYSDIPHKLAKKITNLISPSQQVHQSKIESITPFHLASITGNFAACKLIIDSVDDKNSYNFHDQSSSVSPLHFAAERGYYKICQLIINQIDNRNPEHFFTGFTPLHHAASNGHLKICQLIAKNIDDINPFNDFRITPLHLAAKKGHYEVVKFFCSFIEDKNPIGGFRRDTPLYLAAMEGHLDVCEFLIKAAKEKNPPNLYGKTPLHVASEFGHLDICQLIGGYINDKNPRDKNGMTRLQLAEISTSRNRDKIVQYFNSDYLNSL